MVTNSHSQHYQERLRVSLFADFLTAYKVMLPPAVLEALMKQDGVEFPLYFGKYFDCVSRFSVMVMC
jgi:hypothetical protein